MTVQKQDLKNGEPVADDLFAQLLNTTNAKRPGAIVKRSQMRKARGWFERLMAIGVLLLSLFGSVLAWAGGFVKFAAAPLNPIAWGLGFLSQLALTTVQWMYRAQGFTHPMYLISLGIDVVLTILGFGPIAAPWLAARIVENGWLTPDGAAIAAWLFVAIVAFAMAWYPEDRLVD